MNPARAVGLFLLVSTYSAPLIAQESPSSVAKLRSHIQTLAHDSMLGRPTPSSSLENAAQYVARELAAMGLNRWSDDSSYFSRYPVLETILNEDSARMEIGGLAIWRLGKDYYHAAGAGGVPSGTLKGATAIVTGTVTREVARRMGVRGKVLIFLSPLDPGGRPVDFRSVFALMGAGPLALIVPGARPDSLWHRLREDPDELKPAVEAGWPVWTSAPPGPGSDVVRFIPALELWGGRFNGLLARMAIDSASLYSRDSSAKVTPINVETTLIFARKTERVSRPPNVVAVVQGRDPALRDQFVVVTAHLDGLGMARNAPPGPGSVLNGADDNASGVAALLEIARALGASSERPRRSILLAAVTGEEPGLWGSDYLVSRSRLQASRVTANVNMDMVGRARGDTVFLVTTRDLRTERIVSAVRQAHTGWGLQLLGREALERQYPGENLEERSDHANFVRRGIPAVALFTGLHEDYHGRGDDPDKINYDALARIARMAYDITVALANAEE